MTRKQKWLDQVARQKCLACRVVFNVGPGQLGPAVIHHITNPRDDAFVIPLCPEHHQYGKDAFHRSKRTFREKYGNEWELYKEMLKRLYVPKWVEERNE